MKEKIPRAPGFGEAMLVVLALIAILIGCNIFIGFDAQISLLIGCLIACGFAFYLGYGWTSIEKMIIEGIGVAILAFLINLIIGMLISCWCASGTVGYIIYLSLKLISPKFFLLTTLIACCVLSACTGSSWTTAGTVGIAMLGAGSVMGVSAPMICGAILAGCYFGDKLSPISESTNCASAIAEAPLMEHVHSMTYVVFPATIITAVIYIFAGILSQNTFVPSAEIEKISAGLEEVFWFNPVLLLPMLLMLVMIVKKVPALVTLMVSIVFGLFFCFAFQKIGVKDIASILMDGFKANSDLDVVNNMLKKGGLNSMRNTVTIMLCGLPIGSVLKGTKALEVIVHHFGKLVNTVAKTVAASTVCATVMAAVTGDTYPAYILTGAAFGNRYDALQLDRKNLSRTLEMAVVCNCLYPWTAGGAYMSELFGLSPLEYMPFYYWGFLIVGINIVLGFIGFGMFYTNNRKGWGKGRYIPGKIEEKTGLEISAPAV